MSLTSVSAIQSWMTARAPLWNAIAQKLSLRGRRVSVTEALSTVDDYRNLARDLATARRFMPGTRTTARLETLYAQLHAVIRHKPRNSRAALLDMFRYEIPSVVAELRSRILWIVALFVLSTAAGWWLISTFPDLITLVASEKMIANVEEGKLWTDDLLNITPSSLLSVRIFSNNIAVSVFAVCAGFFFGLGTFYIIATNGLMLGGTFAFVAQHQLAQRLFKFIVAHGLVELSVICIAGAIGAAIGDSLIRPTHATRRDSFQHCMQRTAPLILLCALLLIGAGLIEGFVSPDPQFPMISRVIIGVCYWVLMLLALTGRLFGRRSLA
jgi:uncharacterized membrane protein SpoIIM required for sporulation